MLKDLFLPEKIDNYYLFAKRILGLDIGKTRITATKVFVRGRTTLVESIVTKTLPHGTHDDYQDRVTKTMSSILEAIGTYDTIVSSLPASVVFFKELTLPFTNRDKIKLVIEYEVESLLPFNLDQAVIDFIITDSDTEKSTILVATTQKNQLAEHLSLFEASGIHPDTVTVDLFSIYSLFKEIPAYKEEVGNCVLALIESSSTKMAYLVGGKLKLIRTIPKGALSLTQHSGSTPKGSTQKAQEQFMPQSFSVGSNNTALRDFLTPFQFTLQSFSKETKADVQKLYITGSGAHIKDLAQTLTQRTGVPTELFSVDSLARRNDIQIKANLSVSPEAIVSLSTALPTSLMEAFNLRAKEFGTEDQNLFVKQIVIAATLVLLIIGTLVTNNFLQARKLRTSLEKSEKQIFTAVNQTLGISAKRAEIAVDEARRNVEEQERTWFSFTAQTRSSFLNQLQTLSQHIDKKGIGLQLTKLSFTHDLIRMQGEVKDIPSLIVLEEELKQADIGSFTSPQEPKFTINITLKKKAVEE